MPSKRSSDRSKKSGSSKMPRHPAEQRQEPAPQRAPGLQHTQRSDSITGPTTQNPQRNMTAAGPTTESAHTSGPSSGIGREGRVEATPDHADETLRKGLVGPEGIGSTTPTPDEASGSSSGGSVGGASGAGLPAGTGQTGGGNPNNPTAAASHHDTPGTRNVNTQPPTPEEIGDSGE